MKTQIVGLKGQSKERISTNDEAVTAFFREMTLLQRIEPVCCELFSRRTFSKAGIARVLRVWPDWHRLLRPNSRGRVVRFLQRKVLARLPS